MGDIDSGDERGAAAARPPLKAGLPPIMHPAATVLILGTLPGDESLRLQQYYGHPRNHFWPLIAGLAGVELPPTYARRVALLKRSGFALWDVLQSAERSGSLDSAIRFGQPNAFAGVFTQCPRLRAIAFNGQKASQLFELHVMSENEFSARGLSALLLPSSSPTHVRPFEEKLVAWHSALAPFQNLRAM